MFNSVNQFAEFWKSHSDATRKIFNALTEESLSAEVAPEHRNLKRMAWHIVVTIPEMAVRTGLELDGPKADSPMPESLREIQNGYDAIANSLLEQIQEKWTDETLQVEDDIFGESWKRGLSLRIIAEHEIHHRGQMTVLMRQAGLKVPGIYGPSREEWSGYGAPPPEI